ncbi:hypothetical protein GIB67_036496 [Kingdonia uniflora]|uniref:Glycosyltransferase n=1 Tax=Kingdonia uniflora TaxID=39325 RepID=A0A7J7P7J1_9MAGN|nr:hypothetical protein GIB67_036496 [Kingdonia uniflora]
MLTHHPSFSITILITTPPYNTGSTTPYINHISTTTSSILFHHLPIIPLSTETITNAPNQEALAFELLARNNPHVEDAIVTISKTSKVRSLVFDFFCTPALKVGKHLSIPTYYFFTSGVGVIALFLYFPTIHKGTNESFKDIKMDLNIPGLPSFPAHDMPMPMLDRSEVSYDFFLNYSTQLPNANGFIINSFEALEPRAIKAVLDGLCVPDRAIPPIYCIGPLITPDGHIDGVRGTHESLAWLELQPSGSVVFLCFGSLGLFSKAQLKEIATGLEKSGQRFLWVVRSPPTDDKSKRFLAPPDPDLDTLLPHGFFDRTKERGLVLKSWVPQVKVLSHESVGGFVTHCGWNSVLEAVCAGVPMVAWPLYAEQHVNKTLLVEEMKLALPMNASDDGFVSSSEVEKRVTEVMGSGEGNALRERTMRLKECAKVAMSEGGSSRRALAEVVELWSQRKLLDVVL